MFERDQLPSSMIEPRNVCKHIVTIDEDGIRDAQTSSGFVSTTTSCLTIINQGCAFFRKQLLTISLQRCSLLFPDPPARDFYFPFRRRGESKNARCSQKSDANRLTIIAIFTISTYDEKIDLLLLLILEFAIPSRRQA